MHLKCIDCFVVYRERPVINTQTVDFDYLTSLPQGTFGREYADWLHVNVRSCSLCLLRRLHCYFSTFA